MQPGSLESEAGIYACTFDKTGTRFITCEVRLSVCMAMSVLIHVNGAMSTVRKICMTHRKRKKRKKERGGFQDR